METYLNFEDKKTKKLLTKLKFAYFVELDIEANEYASEDIKKQKDSLFWGLIIFFNPTL